MTEEQTDWSIYQKAIDKITAYSPYALIYVLVHKMDKIASEQRQSVEESRASDE